MSVEMSKATLGGGCFWCLEAVFQMISGVKRVIPGYAGGWVKRPTYQAVCQGDTGHAEVVQLEFEPAIVTYQELLDIFWQVHDPTTPNRQGADVGPQYRSIILYHDKRQQQIAEASRAAAAQIWAAPIVTEIVPLEHFYVAESYHHNFYRQNPFQGYCRFVIRPKVDKVNQLFAEQVK